MALKKSSKRTSRISRKGSVNFRTLLLFVGLAISLGVTALIATGRFPSPQEILNLAFPRAAGPKPINVIEIRYLPGPVEYQTSQEAKTNALSSQFVTAITEASRDKGYKNAGAAPYAQPVIKKVFTYRRQAPYTTGTNEVWYDSLNTMLSGEPEQNICDYIVANNIDQVWAWFDVGGNQGSAYGYNQEFTRFWSYNVLPVQQGYQPLCGGKRSFIFMGLNQNSESVEFPLHSFGHSMESMLEKVEGKDLFWNRWAGITGAEGGEAKTCGDVHFAPNSRRDYEYNSNSTITMSCENWKPDGTGATNTITCTRWGCTGAGYFKWWLQNLPNANNGLTYSGRPVPNWWDFIADTDNAVANAAYLGQFLMPEFLDTAKPSYVESTVKATQTSGASLSVTQQVTGTNRMLILAASYRSPSRAATDGSTKEQIGSITSTYKVNNVNTTGNFIRINRAINGEYATELWYLIAPGTGENIVKVNFLGNVQDQNISSVNFSGVSQATPFASVAGATQTGSTSNPTITIPTTASQVLFGVTSVYTGSNELTVSGSSRGIYGLKTTNVIGKGAVTAGGSGSTLSWVGKTAWPWAVSAVAINITGSTATSPTPPPVSPSPSIVPSPTPTLRPTPSPTPVPSPSPAPTNTPLPSPYTPPTRQGKQPVIDIKANGSDRLYSVNSTQGVTLSWTVTGATSCTASGAWSGAKALSGTYKLPTLPTVTSVYILSCLGTTGVTFFDQVYVYPAAIPTTTQMGKLFVNGFDDTLLPSTSPAFQLRPIMYLDRGTAPKLTWSTINAGTCALNWTPAISAQPALMPALQNSWTYQLSCKKTPTSAPVIYSANAYIRP